MFKYIAFAMVGLLTGCATLSPAKSQDPDFKVYLQRFEQDAWDHGFKVDLTAFPIYFTDLPNESTEPNGKTLGKCFQIPFLHVKWIEIDREGWWYLSESMREAIVYHELGHCILEREHFEGVRHLPPVEIPKSLMIPSLLMSKWYYKERKFYVDELFSRIGRGAPKHRLHLVNIRRYTHPY